METRPTKENVDTISVYVQRLRTSNLMILEEQKKTNELLEKLLRIATEEQRYRIRTKGK